MTERTDIIIAGGSFVGMALALAAAQAGLSVRLVSAEPLAGGASDARASAITAASRRMLQQLGVWQRVGDGAQPVTEMAISDGSLDDGIRPPFLLFDTKRAGGGDAPAAHIVENGPLRGALADAVSADERIEVHAPAEVTGFERGDHGIAVESDGGSLNALLLVAADGARSSLRRLAGIKTVEWDYDQWGLVAPVSLQRDHGGKAVQHFLPSGPFAFLPLKGRRGSLVWTEKTQEAKRLLDLGEKDLSEELHRRLGYEFGQATLDAPLRGFPLHFLLARSFVAERVALVGDAAHQLHPLAGQGFNLGLKDVAALAETLAEAKRLGLDIGHLSVLERYQRWRRFDAAALAATTDGLNRLFSTSFAPLRAARDFGLGLVQRVPALKRALIREAAGDTGDVPRLLKGEAI